MKIKAGTTCFVSTKGHNGFWYPVYGFSGMTEIERDIENPTLKSWNLWKKKHGRGRSRARSGKRFIWK